MKINTEIILALDPFFSFKENYLKFYKDFEGSLEDFFKLDEISFNDKIWVSISLVEKNIRVKFAVKCAEYVLTIFEEKFQDDKRIRNCIEFLKSIDDFENLNYDQLQLLQFHKKKSYDAAYSVSYSFISVASFDAVSFAAFSAFHALLSVDYYENLSNHNFDAVIYAYNSKVKYYNSYFTLDSRSIVSERSEISSTIFQFIIDLTNQKKE